MRTSTPLQFRQSVTVTFVRWIYRRSRGPDFFSHHLISSFNNVEQECSSWMVRGARELCCRAVDISIIMWTNYYTYANLSTLASSCEVHRRPGSTKVTTINSTIVWSRWRPCYAFSAIHAHVEMHAARLKGICSRARDYVVIWISDAQQCCTSNHLTRQNAAHTFLHLLRCSFSPSSPVQL